jgi:hypothetical protein
MLASQLSPDADRVPLAQRFLAVSGVDGDAAAVNDFGWCPNQHGFLPQKMVASRGASANKRTTCVFSSACSSLQTTVEF